MISTPTVGVEISTRSFIMGNSICSTMQYHMVGFSFKNRYQVVIHVRACRTWEWTCFNQTIALYFTLINTINHRVSNDNAYSSCPAVFDSIFIFFFGFFLLCCYLLRRSIFMFITWIRISLRICVLIKES